MKITIIGAGNSGCAHAFLLSKRGFDVQLLKTSRSMHDDNYEIVEKNKGIWGKYKGETTFSHLSLVTRNPQEVIPNADVLLVLTQSLQHVQIADLVAKHLTSRTKLIWLIPGNLGSLVFRNRLSSTFPDVLFCEGESTPVDARIIEPGMVEILFQNVRNALAFLPRSRAEEGLRLATKMFDNYGYIRSNVIESALHNPNLVVHTVGTIMSASRIETQKGEFWMYRESFAPAVWNIIESLDCEKNSVIKAYGGIPSSYLEECKFRNEENLTIPAIDVFTTYAQSGGPKGPSSIMSRYTTEDVPRGLCALKLLASLANIETPTTDALIHLACLLTKVNLKEIGYTISDLMGRDTVSHQDLMNLVNV